ncbi:MAG TPA: AMP-binding protein [Rhizomicrobium sp.]
MDRRPDGTVLLRSTLRAAPAARSAPHLLDAQAERHPDRPFIRQRLPGHGAWTQITYGEAAAASRKVAQWLIDRNLGAGDAVAILSGASIAHVVFAMGAQRAGVAAAPLSVNYSLLSKTHDKLLSCMRTIGARYAFVADPAQFHPAIRALARIGVTMILDGEAPADVPSVAFRDVLTTAFTDAVEERRETIGDDTVARIVFTSGTAGAPKACVQTQGALMAAVAHIEGLGFLRLAKETVPQLLESMPFSHILAGSYNFNNALRVGATISLDDGKPDPQSFATTLRNLREISPSYFVTAPIGFAMLADALEQDDKLRKTFFKDLAYMVFGGAMLPPGVRARLIRMGREETGRHIPLITNYGATETATATSAYWDTPRTDIIGLPAPGVEIKLAPAEDKWELRVRSASVMPRNGYVGNPDANAAAFDEEGFYRTGDAARFAEPDNPAAGLVFDGRLGEQFKLTSGTWVSAGVLRTDLLEATAPLTREIVVCGENRDHLGALVWLNEPAVRAAFAHLASAAAADMVRDEALRSALRARIERHNAAHPASSRRIDRCLPLQAPLSFDANEVTDKGSANRRVVLAARASEVSRLFAAAADDDVIVPGQGLGAARAGTASPKARKCR